ncbi:MAG: LacI family DNA-binding transcriptional regulator [Candidatus Anaerobiospirillum merdipullorum]|uniref:LacI family DNA-binding transcriptional regulator n=1 Tax=Candidatus Anaerobiospirillum merdipullorum TaxID=2838450 RepID=A0A9E2KR10_9GAMM|nr:LacI family DNA-binding transcriptional regulator [Candidatus Anaerobiospirillum merdipullorum]
MKVTVKSLAQAAGVSRGTVDRVLHNRGSVKPEVALRIKTLAKEFGYVPNRAGRALAASKTPYKIGVLLPSIGNLFFDDVVVGINKAAADYGDLGLEVVVKEVQGYEVATHQAAIDNLLTQNCQALCLSTVDAPEIHDRINILYDQGMPIVLLNTDITNAKRLCYVGSDYKCAGATCGGMLAMCSHKIPLKILIVTGSKLMLGHNLRIAGFIEELTRQGQSFEIIATVESNDSDIRAQEVTLQELKRHPDINCVYVTGAGVQGVGAALIALDRPEIFAISYDEVYTTKELVHEGIIKFTVCQQPERQGYHAVKRAYQALAGQLPAKTEDFITDTIIKIKANL